MSISLDARSSSFRIPIAAVLLIAMFLASAARAETAEEKGLAIAQEGDRRDRGWKDSEHSRTEHSGT